MIPQRKKVIKDINAFKKVSDVIVANRVSDDPEDVKEKVYTRDLFGNDSYHLTHQFLTNAEC
ncbi:MAG: hypothetical protein IE885_09255 [Campylobacterales bacterium]|nr:hypothetical protein [Campylobacterales bacterium]